MSFGKTSNRINAATETPCGNDECRKPMKQGEKTMLARLPKKSNSDTGLYNVIRKVHVWCVPENSPDYEKAVRLAEE